MSVYSPPCLTLPYLSGFVLSGKPEVSKGYRFDEDSSNGVPSIRKSYRFNILFGVYQLGQLGVTCIHRCDLPIGYIQSGDGTVGNIKSLQVRIV